MQPPSKQFDFDTVDGELLATASMLLTHVHASICSSNSNKEYVSPSEVASTALATAEANGALPPLSADQRRSFTWALERLINKLKISNCTLAVPGNDRKQKQ